MKGFVMLIKLVRVEGAGYAERMFPRASSTMSLAFNTPTGEKLFAVGFTPSETMALAVGSARFRNSIANLVGGYMMDRENGNGQGVVNVSFDDLCKRVERKMAVSN